MDEARFQILARRAKLLSGDYGTGYLRGLRRARHGEAYGTADEHALWSRLGLDGDTREELGRGYRDGLAGVDPSPRIGRPPVPADQRAEPTRPYSIRLTDREIAELQRRGVRGGDGTLAEWLAQPASSPQAPQSGAE